MLMILDLFAGFRVAFTSPLPPFPPAAESGLRISLKPGTESLDLFCETGIKAGVGRGSVGEGESCSGRERRALTCHMHLFRQKSKLSTK